MLMQGIIREQKSVPIGTLWEYIWWVNWFSAGLVWD